MLGECPTNHLTPFPSPTWHIRFLPSPPLSPLVISPPFPLPNTKIGLSPPPLSPLDTSRMRNPIDKGPFPSPPLRLLYICCNAYVMSSKAAIAWYSGIYWDQNGGIHQEGEKFFIKIYFCCKNTKTLALEILLRGPNGEFRSPLRKQGVCRAL